MTGWYLFCATSSKQTEDVEQIQVLQIVFLEVMGNGSSGERPLANMSEHTDHTEKRILKDVIVNEKITAL